MQSIPFLVCAVLVRTLPGLLIAILHELLNVLHGLAVLLGTALLQWVHLAVTMCVHNNFVQKCFVHYINVWLSDKYKLVSKGISVKCPELKTLLICDVINYHDLYKHFVWSFIIVTHQWRAMQKMWGGWGREGGGEGVARIKNKPLR